MADITFYEKYEPRVLIASKCSDDSLSRLCFYCLWSEVYGLAEGISAVDAFKEDLLFDIDYDVIVMSDNFMMGMNNAASAKELRDLGYKGYILCSTDDNRPANIKNYIDQGANKVVSNILEWNEVHAVRWGKYFFSDTFNSRCFGAQQLIRAIDPHSFSCCPLSDFASYIQRQDADNNNQSVK